MTEHGLSDRKMKILHAVIQNYLETGEPVGSRTISKYTDLNLSSATIRNEMADLEELGYIMQPHTSAGRIPSDKGYRLYVDMLMEEKEQELGEMQEQMLDKADRMEQLLKQAARVLASNTNYATMVSTPMNNANKIKFIQLSMVDAEQVIAVIVLGGNVIKNKIIQVEETLSNENLLKLNMLLNTTLNGMSIEEINLGLIAMLKEQNIHLLIIDIMMPKLDGIHATLKIREYSSIPIIFLSAKSEDTDKILGLNIGADDYVTKPFNPLELVARVKSNLRRYTQLGNLNVENNALFTVGGLCINDDTKEVTVDGESVKLTPIEYNILLLLVKNQGKVFSIDQIYESIWNEEAIGADNTVAVHIRHIREKIEINPKEPRYLKVVWGVGYKIEKQAT